VSARQDLGFQSMPLQADESKKRRHAAALQGGRPRVVRVDAFLESAAKAHSFAKTMRHWASARPARFYFRIREKPVHTAIPGSGKKHD
jgi:hypothetical protein